MNRFLSTFNAVGVAALAVLCLMQWQQMSQLRAKLTAATDDAATQAAALAKEKSAHARTEADLADVRDRLAAANTAAEADRARAITAEGKIARLSADTDALKKRLGEWEALAEKQEAVVKQRKAQLDELTAKFNDLAVKYNAMVKSAGN